MDAMVDVAVIGGGAAGLAAAATLGRCRRSVVVIDAGSPRNAPADGVHNFLTREGISPGELVATGQSEVRSYGGEVLTGEVVRVDGGVDYFTLGLADGRAVRARRIIVTTGVVDELPDIAGIGARWGRDVLHCPFCHGWEVRDRRIVVVGTSPVAAHQAHLFRQLSPTVTVVRHAAFEFADEQLEQLRARGIEVVDGPVVGVIVDDDRLTGLRLGSGAEIACDAAVVASTGRVTGAMIESLALPVDEVRMGDHLMATVVATDAMGATGVDGVWAAGNVADARATVVASAASGVSVAMAVHGSLMEHDIATAVAAHRTATAVAAHRTEVVGAG